MIKPHHSFYNPSSLGINPSALGISKGHLKGKTDGEIAEALFKAARKLNKIGQQLRGHQNVQDLTDIAKELCGHDD